MPVKKKDIHPEIYGLVLCGGNSSRMGTDKSMLSYYEKPQRFHVYEMLQPFCQKVFISCSQTQVNSIEDGYTILTDDPAFQNIGPMAALLTAFTQFPGKNILFIGCDYPFLTAADLSDFLSSSKTAKRSAAFYNQQEAIYEPLLARYSYQAFDALKKMYKANQYSLQLFLSEGQALKYYPAHKNSFTSIDTWEDYIKAVNQLK
jgi:molybdopterin-guanine dinucleotide biosynthesis protein A